MIERALKDGWRRVSFGDIVRLNTDRVADPLAASIERYVGLEHITPEDLRIRSWGMVVEGTTFTNYFKPGQVLFGKRRAYQRKVAVADFAGVCSSDIYVFEPRDERLLPELLPFICQTEAFYQHAVGTSAGSLSPRTNWEQLAKYEFALPPVEEQRRIAEVLRAVDEVVVKWNETSKQLETLRAVVREQILCDKKLPRKKLKTCVRSITAGKSVLGTGRSANNHEFGVLKVSAVGAEGFVASENKVLINADDFIPGFSVHNHDLLITRANTRELVGKVSIALQDYPNLMLSDKTLRLEVDEMNGDKNYLFRVLQSNEARLQIQAVASGTGGAMKNISQVQIMNLTLPLPDIAIQKELAAQTKSLEQSLSQIRSHLQKSLELKKNLLNNLLSFEG